jgi:putative flippase GtrA
MPVRHLLAQLLQREAHPAVQFVKYGLGGCIAAGSHLLVFFVLAMWFFPALLPDSYPDAYLVKWFNVKMPALDEAIRQRNFLVNNGIAFLFSNAVAYWINFRWVFHPGRHRQHIEIVLFLIVSVISMTIGVQLGLAMMRVFEATTTISQISNIVTAVLINFVCRKYFVFLR